MSRQRTRIAEGIYRDAYGLSATVKVAGVQREKRYPADTDLRILESWKIQTRADLDTERDQTRGIKGTLAADGEKFLTRRQGAVGYKSDRAHLRAWYPRFGKVHRAVITAAAVEEQIAAWRVADVAVRTILHRCRMLRACYHGLDGPKAKTPVDAIKLPRRPEANPVAVSIAVMRRVAANLKRARLTKDYARFLVRATTGQRPAQIMAATATDLDLVRKIWFVAPAKGGQPIPLPLNDGMIAAWKVFIKAQAWGPFDTWRAAKVLRQHGWPKDVRPYNLRHTFAIDLLLGGADLRDVQGLLGHRRIATTTQYTPVLLSRLAGASKRRRLQFA